MIRRPEITNELIKYINDVITQHPNWNRTKISQFLCEQWDWRMPNKTLKDISCRDMLRSLDKAGKIKLPKPVKTSNAKRVNNKLKYIQTFICDKTPIETKLSALQPLRIEVIEEKWRVNEFKAYIENFHYLGFDRTVGENMKYMVYSNDGRLLACLLFGSAAWSCRDRDEYIGWSAKSRKSNLQETTNNVRYLIVPWVTVSCLASHILGLIAKRVSSDWEHKYGHSLNLLETFVEKDRFRGTCYKAANWVFVGSTKGRGRNSFHGGDNIPVKDIHVYPLVRDFLEKLNRKNDEL